MQITTQNDIRLTIRKQIIIPDQVKMARYRKVPELGPRILFFSGGSALRRLSRQLKKYTYNSIHVITAFDSGGSSAVLRRAFKMLAIGDLRARLMDLADQTIFGNPEIYELFTYRFSIDVDKASLALELSDMVQGRHPLVQKIPSPMRRIIKNHLFWFKRRMPAFFDLRGASIGNLILTAGYLENRRHPDTVIYIFSRLVQVKGTVRPIVNRYLHLVAELADGCTVVGQHMVTGKVVPPLKSKIKKIYLSENTDHPEEASVHIREKMRQLICEAELICYPMGSFYSSIIANLLPRGVGATIAYNHAPKVYVPNMGHDPECIGIGLNEQVHKLIEYGCRDSVDIAPADIVNFVVIDSKNGSYQGSIDKENLKKMGIEVIDCRLVSERSAPLIDEELLLPVLLSLT